MEKNTEESPKPIKENKEIYKIYYDVLSRISNQVNWLLFTLVTITATIAIMAFSWEMGGIKMASKREGIYKDSQQKTLQQLRIDSSGYEISKITLINDSLRLISIGRYFVKKDSLLNKIAVNKDSINMVSKIIKESNVSCSTLEEVKKKTLTSNVPFLGITLGLPDFSAALYMISFVFLVSLYALLKYLKNVLKNFFNIPVDASKETAAVHNLFYVIYPGNERITRYKYFEFAIYFYLFVLAFALCFDVSTIFEKNHLGLSMYDKLQSISHDNIFEMLSYLVIELVLILVLLMALFFSFKIFNALKDIRNILILVRWQKPFVDAIQELLKKEHCDKLKTPMVYYGLFDYDRKEKVLYKAMFDGYTKVIVASVDLAASLYHYNKNIQPSEFYRVFHKADITHHEIGDEYMKLFFKKLVNGTMNSERELSNNFNIGFADFVADENENRETKE